MLITIGWAALGIECLASVGFGIVFFRLWSRSAMSRGTAARAILVYMVGCIASLAIAFFLPI